jgi:hypothetical protein
MFGKRRRTAIGAVVSLLLAGYMSVYAVLSYYGRYEPATIGLNGVKWHSWAPRGFYADLTWRQEPLMFFAPLYWADTCLWHTDGKVDSGRYPVTEVDPKDIWKYYEAAGLLEVSIASEDSDPALLDSPNTAEGDNSKPADDSRTADRVSTGVIGIITLDGQPAANATVELVPADGARAASAQTNASGQFVFEKGVAPGEYRVRFNREASPVTGDGTEANTDAVTNPGGDASKKNSRS